MRNSITHPEIKKPVELTKDALRQLMEDHVRSVGAEWMEGMAHEWAAEMHLEVSSGSLGIMLSRLEDGRHVTKKLINGRSHYRFQLVVY